MSILFDDACNGGQEEGVQLPVPHLSRSRPSTSNCSPTRSASTLHIAVQLPNARDVRLHCHGPMTCASAELVQHILTAVQ
ncbi:hypothetical protein, partial [Massilia phosphatilytica]